MKFIIMINYGLDLFNCLKQLVLQCLLDSLLMKHLDGVRFFVFFFGSVQATHLGTKSFRTHGSSTTAAFALVGQGSSEVGVLADLGLGLAGVLWVFLGFT